MTMRLFKRLAAALLAVALVMPLATSAPALAAEDIDPETGKTVRSVLVVPTAVDCGYRVGTQPTAKSIFNSSPAGSVYQSGTYYRPTSSSVATPPSEPHCVYTTYYIPLSEPGHVSSVHFLCALTNGSSFYNYVYPFNYYVVLTSSNGSTYTSSGSSNSPNISVEFGDYQGDIVSASFSIVSSVSTFNGSTSPKFFSFRTDSYVVLSQFEETGLLRSIIEWLKGIKDGIAHGFSSVLSSLSGLLSAISSGFSSVLSSLSSLLSAILELPEKIINLFKTAMQWLFVPSQDDLSNLSERFETVMSTKLGGVWEVESFIVGLLTGIIGAGSKTTITFPGISVPLAGSTFSLASQEVEIFPGALSALQTPCKIMVTAVFLGAWLYGVQRYLDKFLGGGDSE